MFNHHGGVPSLFMQKRPNSASNAPSTSSGVNKSAQRALVTTSSSIIALQYSTGVIIAGDMLGYYGTLARYTHCPRVLKVNDNIILGASGDYADFQYVWDLMKQKVSAEEDRMEEGTYLKPHSLHCWLTRLMYRRKCMFDPLWNNFLIGGNENGVPFLGTVDKLGTSYTDKIICTGFGAQMAAPLIRNALEKNPHPTQKEAVELVEKCMNVLFYRDAEGFCKYQIAICDMNSGTTVEGPIALKHDKSFTHAEI
ncbi:proteasome subunit beta type-4 isoform X2 [Aethina tumida]|uniref:proteasome subunit beta type-4 isoform X2 n=1 Tax=Aethina tumida TaxID=116153 RepID=UPI00096B61D3|nr:proteasome subunit beta type-4 isoform X2 [Aethina tumida]